MKMYKLPNEMNPMDLKTVQGSEGTYLNPIQDVNGNWVISPQEYEADEFAEFRANNSNFELIETELKKINLINDPINGNIYTI